MSTLNRILARLEDTAVSEKTASDVKEIATAGDPTERMLETVRALASKTASAPAPTTSVIPTLDKIAAETAALEDHAMRKQAELAGAAFMDGAMARLAAYDGAFGKTAAAGGASQADLQAAYAQGQADLEKKAADAYAQGQEATLQEVHKIASEIHIAGQQSARNVLAALSQEA